ncbi:hypothetical protein [Novosphingobium sp.]|uniref:hypothetical protein n=1 Tax=Novosphingobium sp. TaxID=1874826 RepID=UPI00352A4166
MRRRAAMPAWQRPRYARGAPKVTTGDEPDAIHLAIRAEFHEIAHQSGGMSRLKALTLSSGKLLF